MIEKRKAKKQQPHRTPARVAILVDGSFFLKRFKPCYGYIPADAKAAAKTLHKMLMKHVGQDDLYRILYYDCKPFEKGSLNPISRKYEDFKSSASAKFRIAFFEELKKIRKFAIRLGYLKSNKTWAISPKKTAELIKGEAAIDDLQPSDVKFDLKQKGVDIKIGLDIASLTYKKLVNKIILISGDSDFVPAAKLARREGVDFVLDPMWNHIDPDLHEHIDGLRSTCPIPSYLVKDTEPPATL